MNTELKAWVEEYLVQMRFEYNELLTLDEEESTGVLESPLDYYDLGVEHGTITSTIDVLTRLQEMLDKGL